MSTLVLFLARRILPALAVSISLAAHAADFPVAAGDVDGLREAIEDANNSPGADTVTLEPGTYILTEVDNNEEGPNELPLINSAITISVADGGSATIFRSAAAPSFRLFTVTSNGALGLVNITLAQGVAALGGAIFNEGTAIVQDCLVTQNNSTSSAGAIFSSGLLSIDRSTISTNESFSDGGGILNTGSGFISSSLIYDNYAARGGGGIANLGNLQLSNVTISGNRADVDGGGIVNTSDISGGGSGVLTVNNATIAFNTSDTDSSGFGDGGGILNSASATFRNSIISNNDDLGFGGDAPDCAGEIVSQGYNLIQSDEGCTITGDLTGNLEDDPLLVPLADNGGLTLTHRILAGSPALDAGNPAAPGSGGTSCLSLDQRGAPRPIDGNGSGNARCDIGAYEFGGVALPPLTDDFAIPPEQCEPVSVSSLTVRQHPQQQEVSLRWDLSFRSSAAAEPSATYQVILLADFEDRRVRVYDALVEQGLRSRRVHDRHLNVRRSVSFRNPRGELSGLRNLTIQEKPGNQDMLRVSARGTNILGLDPASLPSTERLIAQVINTEGQCWQARFDAPARVNGNGVHYEFRRP